MTSWGSALHQDSNAVKTSASYGNPGDGTTNWFEIAKLLDGGDVTQGLKADAAITDPTVAASVVALLKGLLTANRLSAAGMLKAEDTAHASGDAGVMLLAVRNDARATLAGTDLDYSPMTTGTAGNVMSSPVPTTLSAWSTSRAATTAAAASLIVKAAAGKLYMLHITNGATAQFVQIHNTITVVADGAVPVYSVRVAADESRTLDLSEFGDNFTTGIMVCNSSTLATKTIGAADMFLTAQYI